MSGNNESVSSDSCDVRLGRTNCAFKASASRVVNEGEMTIPPRVTRVKNFSVCELDGNIRIRISRAVMFEKERLARGLFLGFLSNFTDFGPLAWKVQLERKYEFVINDRNISVCAYASPFPRSKPRLKATMCAL